MHIHPSIEADRQHTKSLFSHSGGSIYATMLKSRDGLFHHCNTFSYILHVSESKMKAFIKYL
jgi:hypothetical protein